MINDKKQLIVEVSERFHNEIKILAAKSRKTVKQMVIEALVDYINREREKDV